MDNYVWDIKVKKGPGGAGDVTEEQKNEIINKAVHVWSRMRLTSRQIAFGIATMNVESGFNPEAKNPDTNSTAKGLGQILDGTWKATVRNYNKNFKSNLDADSSRTDTDAQIAVMGEYIFEVWKRAVHVSSDKQLKNFTHQEIAYAVWHEGTNKDSDGLAEFINNPKKFTPVAKSYFNVTYDYVNEGVTNILTKGVPVTRLDLLDRRSLTSFFQFHPDVVGRLGILSRQNMASGETLRREGNHVYRVEADGSVRGFFISE